MAGDRMSKIHPTAVTEPRKKRRKNQIQKKTRVAHPTALQDASKCHVRKPVMADGRGRPSVWTVWKKPSMAFPGTDGFSIFDSDGRLAFRVDNYSRRRKCVAGDLVLMDGAGKALITLRPQILSLHDQWNGFQGDEGSRAMPPRAHLFSVRRKRIFQNSDDAEVFMGRPTDQSPAPDFRIDGCFWRRRCKIRASGTGEVVSEITRKVSKSSSVILTDDVFSLVVQSSVDEGLMMAFIVVMDRICQKRFSPLLCC